MAGRAQTPSSKHREVFRRGLSDPSPSHSTVPSSPKVLIAPYYKTWPLFSVNQMKTPGIVLSIYRVRLSVHLSLFSVSSEIIMLKHNSYFHRSDLYIFIHTSSQPLGGILWCGITVRGAARSAQYSTSSRDINVILGFGLRDIQHRTEGRGLDCSGFGCLCVMGMASVSWFYLFNIQVRANCTTACNIQAALQYVELTRVSRFFLFVCLFTKMCMQLGTGSKVMLPLPPPGGRSLQAGRRMSVGVPTDRSDWPTFTEMHEEKNCDNICCSVCLRTLRRNDEENRWREDCCFLSFFLFLIFLAMYYYFFLQNVKLFVVKKSSSCACV